MCGPDEKPKPAPRSPLESARRRRLALAAADLLTVIVSLGIVIGVFGSPRGDDWSAIDLAEAAALVSVWMLAIVANRLYLSRCVERFGEELRRILSASAWAVGVCLAYSYVVGADLPERSWVVGSFVIVSIGLVLERLAARAVFGRMRRSGHLARRIAIIGTDDHAVALRRAVIDAEGEHYQVVGLIGDRPSSPTDAPVLGGYDRIIDVLREQNCVGAIISSASMDSAHVNSFVRALNDAQLHVALSTSMRDLDLQRMRPQDLHGEVLVYVEPSVRSGWRMYAKRAFDVVFASVALVLALPLLAVVAIAIKLDSHGPVLFRQERVGHDGETFRMLKLRTMRADADQMVDQLQDLNEADGPMFKIKNDPRITRVGRLLRKTSIDEIPQFVNVLFGQMSVVGPRPALPREVLDWDDDLRKRLEVMPGVTGLWQVSGRSDSSFDEYRRLDLYYVDNWTLGHDVRVVAKTFWVVLASRGAS